MKVRCNKIIGFLTGILLSLSLSAYTHALSLDYIYINSSVDEAAGGHTAVRLGETVFHFQYYDNGLFLLEKDHWKDFYYQYSNMQNRTIAIASMDLSDDLFYQIKNQFLTRYLLQEKRFHILNQLKKQLEHVTGEKINNHTIEIKGLGFFDKKGSTSRTGQELYRNISKALGADFILKLETACGKKVANHELSTEPMLPDQRDFDYYTPVLSPAGIEDYRQSLAFQEALSIIKAGVAVRRELFITDPVEKNVLNAEEVETLQRYKAFVFHSIINLLTSKRSDQGESLLLQTARYHALAESINGGNLVTLFPFSDDHSTMDVEQLKDIPIYGTTPSKTQKGTITYLSHLKSKRKLQAEMARSFFMKEDIPSELPYNLLESTFGRLWEIEHVDKNNVQLRNEGRYLLPSKKGVVTDHRFKTKNQTIQIRVSLSEKFDTFTLQLKDLYSYNLFQKNCVTELFETIYSNFISPEVAKNELGGYLEPGERSSFVPFISFAMFQQRFPVSQIEVLPSFRLRFINKHGGKAVLLSYLQESNTITSTLYHPWVNDTVFLFFTDNSVLLRPIFGSINFVYGAFGSITGLLASPLDKGKLLKRSCRGMLFSLPEIFFINIRKGTFPATQVIE